MPALLYSSSYCPRMDLSPPYCLGMDFRPFMRGKGRLPFRGTHNESRHHGQHILIGFPLTSIKREIHTARARSTVTMQEQIEMSGLEIMSSLSSSSSSSSSQLQWNSTNQWSPLLGGGRACHACVTILSGSGENDGQCCRTRTKDAINPMTTQ